MDKELKERQIKDNTSNLRDAFKIIRSSADRLGRTEDSISTLQSIVKARASRIDRLENNHEVLLSRLEALELQVKELVGIARQLEEWI